MQIEKKHMTQACATDSNLTGSVGNFRIDPRFFEFSTLPWRKIHLDFHNSKHVPRIAEKFNADQWGDQLLAGNVDSVVVFAKDMHGYFYYPSQYGPVHPGLSFDLLDAQVKACRQRNITVYAYYCTAWDDYLADAHPEWNMVKRDGTDYRPKTGETPGWTALCLGNKEFVNLMADHIHEFISKYELNGAWLDMAEPITAECYCKECLRQIRASGLDPYDKEVQRLHQNKNFIDFHRQMKAVVKAVRPDAQIDFNDIGLGRVSERVEFLDSIDIEALPTDPQWGYMFAPVHIRYQRNFGVPVFGMTGRFVSSWADFGGLKLPQQLDVELASISANAARCDVGDQMPPDGVLDAAVYHVIGKSYGRIKKLEPWLHHTAPVTEAALLIPDIVQDRVLQQDVFGMAKLMMECHLQFDVVEPCQAWESYKLVVIPDELRPDDKMAERLHKYIAAGGAVIVSHHAGLSADTGLSWLELYGFSYKGDSPYKPAYLAVDSNFVESMPAYAYALYEGASQWEVNAPAKTMAQLGEPLFQRSAEHYTSHKHTPFDHATDYSVLAVSGRVGLLGFPLGASYYSKGYWVYRSAFEKLLDQILPQRLIETSAPLSTEVTVTYQPGDAQAGFPDRYMVHLINWSPSRKTPLHPEVHEDPVALTDVKLRLNIPLPFAAVRTAESNEDLFFKVSDGGVEVTVPRILIHEIICFELPTGISQ